MLKHDSRTYIYINKITIVYTAEALQLNAIIFDSSMQLWMLSSLLNSILVFFTDTLFGWTVYWYSTILVFKCILQYDIYVIIKFCNARYCLSFLNVVLVT